MSEQQSKYFSNLTDTAQQSQDSYDKTVLALSGGAFGLTITFVKELIRPTSIEMPFFLILAWFFWIVSVSVVLFSFFSSNKALLCAAKQYADDPINFDSDKAGGLSNAITNWLNIFSGTFCVFGMVAIMLFVSMNLQGEQYGSSQEKASGKETSSKEKASGKETSSKEKASGKETSGKEKASGQEASSKEKSSGKEKASS